jgi:hypothetical protein
MSQSVDHDGLMSLRINLSSIGTPIPRQDAR